MGCVPFVLTPTPETIRADEASSSLVVSEVIRDASGTPVPDGTLFTITSDNGQIGAAYFQMRARRFWNRLFG